VFVAVDAGVLVEVGVRVGEGVAGMPRARPQAARKVAVREVRVSLRKSRRERLRFGDISALPMKSALLLECSNQLVIF
jgi:hypothetical protein